MTRLLALACEKVSFSCNKDARFALINHATTLLPHEYTPLISALIDKEIAEKHNKVCSTLVVEDQACI